MIAFKDINVEVTNQSACKYKVTIMIINYDGAK